MNDKIQSHMGTDCRDCGCHTFEHILRLPSYLSYTDLWQCRGCKRVITISSSTKKPVLPDGVI